MTRKRSPLLPLCAAAFFLVGCKSEGDWMSEVILQLFRPASSDLGKFTVSATQKNGKQGQVVLEDSTVFANCESNRVRVIPLPGSALPLEISVSGGALPKTIVETFSLDAGAAVKEGGRTIWRYSLVIGQGAPLVPVGCGAMVPDAGPPTDSNADAKAGDSATGDPCSDHGQCKGNTCLTSITVGGTVIPMPDGYCSRDCGKNACSSGEKCVDSTDGNLRKIGAYCLKVCSVPAQCRSTYRCTTDGVCFAK